MNDENTLRAQWSVEVLWIGIKTKLKSNILKLLSVTIISSSIKLLFPYFSIGKKLTGNTWR